MFWLHPVLFVGVLASSTSLTFFSLSLSHKKTDFITLFIVLVSLAVTHFLYDLNDLIPNIQKGNSLCCVFCLAPFLVCVSNYLNWINLDLDVIKLFDSSGTK